MSCPLCLRQRPHTDSYPHCLSEMLRGYYADFFRREWVHLKNFPLSLSSDKIPGCSGSTLENNSQIHENISSFSGVISNNKRTIIRHLPTGEKLAEMCARIQISLTNLWTGLCGKWAYLRHRHKLQQLWCITIHIKQEWFKSFTVHIEKQIECFEFIPSGCTSIS